MKLEDFVTPEQLYVLHRRTEESEALPCSIYGESFYQLENQQVFPYTWAAVAVSGDLPNPGDAFPVMLGEWPILLVRNKKGEINAFLNICRHRRMRVVTEPRKKCQTLACPWHCWTYDLDGNLLLTPHIQGHNKHDMPIGLKREELGLQPVQVGVWNDAIFVNIKGGVPDFAEFRKPIDQLFADYDLSEARYAGQSEHCYEGNWKVAVEGGIENYHLRWGHPQTVEGVIDSQVEFFSSIKHRYSAFYERSTFNLQVSSAQSVIEELPTFCKQNASERASGFHVIIASIFPTAAFVLFRDHLNFALFLPDGPHRTRLVFNYYFKDDATQDPAHEDARQTVIKDWEETTPQDDDYVRYVYANTKIADQAGLKARFTPYWEKAVHEFQKILVDTIQSREQSQAQ